MCDGATIADNYWVGTADEADLTWADVGFRENYFVILRSAVGFSSFAKVSRRNCARRRRATNIGSYEVLAAAGRALGHGESGTPEHFPGSSRRHSASTSWRHGKGIRWTGYVISKDFANGELSDVRNNEGLWLQL